MSDGIPSLHDQAGGLGTVREQIAHASNEDVPQEACGFVLDTGAVVHCKNVDDAPWYRFTMDLADVRTWWSTGRVVGVWHSHPTGPAVPSEVDAERALYGVQTLIYSVEDEDLGTYRLEQGNLVLESMESPA